MGIKENYFKIFPIRFIYKQSANGGIQIKKEINGSDERIFLKINAIQQEYIDKMMDVCEFLKSQQSKAIPIL